MFCLIYWVSLEYLFIEFTIQERSHPPNKIKEQNIRGNLYFCMTRPDFILRSDIHKHTLLWIRVEFVVADRNWIWCVLDHFGHFHFRLALNKNCCMNFCFNPLIPILLYLAILGHQLDGRISLEKIKVTIIYFWVVYLVVYKIFLLSSSARNI